MEHQQFHDMHAMGIGFRATEAEIGFEVATFDLVSRETQKLFGLRTLNPKPQTLNPITPDWRLPRGLMLSLSIVAAGDSPYVQVPCRFRSHPSAMKPATLHHDYAE